jgi:hypothetical protein
LREDSAGAAMRQQTGGRLMGWCWALAAVAAAAVGAAPAAAQPREPVDLELAFLVDASGSIDEEEMRLQRQGYVDALLNTKVLDAISSGFHRSIAVAYIEFAGFGCARVSVAWTRISDATSARSFGERILGLGRLRQFCPGGNAIGEAMALAAQSIAANGFEGLRRAIDLSGDGPNTVGPPVEPVRDAAVADGITINGLVIDRPTFPNLEEYFRRNMTGGPRSFVIKVENRAVFGEAILKKLILEIAGDTPPSQEAQRR